MKENRKRTAEISAFLRKMESMGIGFGSMDAHSEFVRKKVMELLKQPNPKETVEYWYFELMRVRQCGKESCDECPAKDCKHRDKCKFLYF